jgi:[NiFe] hydrogenase diaphorase moiety large subunit
MKNDTYMAPMTFDGIDENAGLKAALGKNRADIIDEIMRSGLKGRGGAGFPTGVKWNLTASAASDEKFVVCNADEGEPGTFKDRALLCKHPDLLFEGMSIAAYTIGAKKGYIYLRAEYEYLRKDLEEIIEKRVSGNLLGKNIMDKESFDFDIEIRMGSGAYICGEETALIESMEGFRGEPRNRPPFPVDTGFTRKPTSVNNVETFMWAACILAKGAEWFKEIGTEKSSGLKIFSVSGDCDKPGVYEFPMGITVGELLDKVGGKNAKAVQIGGASGVCVPADEFERKIAYEDVSTGGSIIVFGPGRDMLHAAKNFLEFFVEESCGQCTPCREGNAKLLEGVELLEKGKCSMRRLNDLIKLGETMQLASKCGLGQSSPNAFLSIVKNFKHEIMGRSSAA